MSDTSGEGSGPAGQAPYLTILQTPAQTASEAVSALPTVAAPASPAAAASPASPPAAPNIAWGATIPWLFGKVQVMGQIVWCAPPTYIVDDSGNSIAVLSFAIIFGRPSPRVASASLLKLYFDANLVYDADNTDGLPIVAVDFDMTFYDGTQVAPDPAIIADKGDLATAFMGRMYCVINNYSNPASNNFPVVQAVMQIDDGTVPGGANLYPFAFDQVVDYASSVAVYLADLHLLYCLRNPVASGHPFILDIFDTTTNSLYDTINVALTSGQSQGSFLSPNIFQVSAVDNAIYFVTQNAGVTVVQLSSAQGRKLSLSGDVNLLQTMQHVSGFNTFDNTGLHEFLFVGSFDGKMRIIERHKNALSTRYTSDAIGSDVTRKPAYFVEQKDYTDVGVDNTLFTHVYFSAGQHIYRYTLTSNQQEVAVGACTIQGPSTLYERRAEGLTLMATIPDGLTCTGIYVSEGGKTVSAHVGDGINNSWLYIYKTFYGTYKLGKTGTLPTRAQVMASGGFDTFTLQAVAIPPGTAGQRTQYLPAKATQFAYASVNKLVTVNILNGAHKVHNYGDWQLLPSLGVYDYGLQFFDSDMIYEPGNNSLLYTRSLGGKKDSPGRAFFGGIKLADRPAYTIGDAFTDLSLLAGYTDDEIEVSGMTDIVTGMILNTAVNYSDVVAQLAAAFRVDVLETTNFGIRFTKPPSVLNPVTIGPDDQLAQNSSSASYRIGVQNVSNNVLPNTLQLAYIDPDAGFVVGMQTARRMIVPRPSMTGKNVLQISIPIVMQATTALYWVGYALFDMWSGALTYTFGLPPYMLKLECGDFITLIQISGATAVCKIISIQYNVDNTMTIVASGVSSRRATPRDQIPIGGV